MRIVLLCFFLFILCWLSTFLFFLILSLLLYWLYSFLLLRGNILNILIYLWLINIFRRLLLVALQRNIFNLFLSRLFFRLCYFVLFWFFPGNFNYLLLPFHFGRFTRIYNLLEVSLRRGGIGFIHSRRNLLTGSDLGRWLVAVDVAHGPLIWIKL